MKIIISFIILSLILLCNNIISQKIPSLFIDYQYIINKNSTGICEVGLDKFLFSPQKKNDRSINLRSSYSIFKIDNDLINKIEFGFNRTRLLAFTPDIFIIYYFGLKYLYSWNKGINLNSGGAYAGLKIKNRTIFKPFLQFDFEINKQFNSSVLKIGTFINLSDNK